MGFRSFGFKVYEKFPSISGVSMHPWMYSDPCYSTRNQNKRNHAIIDAYNLKNLKPKP